MVMNMDAPDQRNGWIDDRLRALDPPGTWEPSTAVALAHFRERAAAAEGVTPRTVSGVGAGLAGLFGAVLRRRAWNWIAAASVACLILLLTPATRAAAQRLWNVFFAQRVEFVTLDMDKLPRSLTEQRVRLNGATMPVGSLSSAETIARFAPRLPDASIVSAAGATPRLYVTGTITVESRINVADLEAAANTAGLAELRFPKPWDRARVAVHSSPLVIADYPEFQLMQSMPLAITTPPDLDLAAFTENVLRIGGLGAAAARTFAARMAAAPFALLAISPEEQVRLREVKLRMGEGTLVHDLNDDGSLQRTTLVWTTPDRMYAISSNLPDDELIAIADAIPFD